MLTLLAAQQSNSNDDDERGRYVAQQQQFTAERVTLTGREAEVNGTEQEAHRCQRCCQCGDSNAGDVAACNSIKYTAETARAERNSRMTLADRGTAGGAAHGRQLY